MQKLMIIDGNALLHRAFHAFPALTTAQGEMVNAVYGFAVMLLLALEKLQPTHVVVVFDEKGPTFRHQDFTQYKAQRQPMDEGLAGQIDRTRQMVRAFQMPVFAINGYEADDIIGTIVEKMSAENHHELDIVMVTGDKDLLQLLRPGVWSMMPGKSFNDEVMYDVEAFQKRFGLEYPKQLIDLKALMGDSSDNIPGVSGIGEKTAQKLIAEYGDIETLYARIDELSGKLKEKLAEGAEIAVLSKKLATIDCAVPLQFDLNACKRDGVDLAEIKALFTELGFKSLMKKLDKMGGHNYQDPIINNQKITNDQSSKNENEDGIGQKGLFEENVEMTEEEELKSLQAYLDGQPEQVKALDCAMIPVLRRMKEHGVEVDRQVLEKMSGEFATSLEQLVKSIYEDVGHEFNLNSPKQLAEVLFDDLKLPVIRKTKTGRSTNEEVLKELITAHPVIEKVLEYRELFKLKSTYIDGLPKYIAEDSRIHSTLKLDVAATGRLSSIDPNLQNIPIRSSWGSAIRKAFVAPDGYDLLTLDYSQIELRILAHLSEDEGLRGIFQRGEDVHRSTAAKIFNLPPEQVTKDQRRSAKTINFGLMYGMGPRALAQDLKITYSQAELFIKAYFAAFPKVKHYMDSVIAFGKEHGYVETILGRRRFLPELTSTDMRLQSAGVRMAINMPCQGTQAEMIKRAMVAIDKLIEKCVIPSKDGSHREDNNQDPIINHQIITNNQLPICKEIAMILQIHDELMFEVKEGRVGHWADLIRKEMLEALPLSVPIEVGISVGKSWGEMQELR